MFSFFKSDTNFLVAPDSNPFSKCALESLKRRDRIVVIVFELEYGFES